ncbi:trehalose operon transcriptional repressor [Vibrio ponticus]|nr:trehalose operon transcriptional repressor [Vibrio ponticus]
MLQALYQAGYDVVIMESQFDPQKTTEHLDVLKRRNVDGVIVFGFSNLDLSQLERWQNRVVVIAMDTQQVSSINYDNHGVITQALEHLQQQDLTQIAYIG